MNEVIGRLPALGNVTEIFSVNRSRASSASIQVR